MQKGTERLATAHSEEGVGVVLLKILTSNIGFARPSKVMQNLQEDLITAIYEEDDSGVMSPSSVPFIPPHRHKDLWKIFLDRLRYPDMEDRKDRIVQAYEKTFRWIFQDDPSQQNRWSNFREWLESDSQIYWITGKAGSGKSTLIKYICQEENCHALSSADSLTVEGADMQGLSRCTKYLKKWAGDSRVITAAFFFWNSGVRYQKSQRGLLLSLLYPILQEIPTIIPFVSPRSWEVMCLFNGDGREWTEAELHQMLRTAVKEVSKTMKLCFFVDGLDEFDGQHQDLICLFRDLIEHPNVKVCVSSRPWLVFEEAFMHKPSMMLQDLTYADIKHYVRSNLQGNQGFEQLLKREPHFANQLIENIASKASGVFLWVKLVVASLLAGMTYGDRTSDLQRRLDLLPPDLEALYEKMLKSLDPFYLEHAAQLFKFIEESEDPPSLILLSYADEEDTESAISRPIEPASREDLFLRADTMRRRLNSRCKGFLEVERNSNHPELSNGGTVQYLHRTVKDYLASEGVQKTLSAALKPSFDPHVSMCAGSLAYLKTIRDDAGFLGELFWTRVNICLDSASRVRKTSRAKRILLLDELDRTGSTIWRRVSRNADPRITEVVLGQDWSRSLFKEGRHWVASHPHINNSMIFGPNFLSLAVRYGFVDYVRARANQACLVQRSGSEEWPLLLDAIYAEKRDILGSADAIAKPEMIACILEHGADPNYSLARVGATLPHMLQPTIWHQTAIHILERHESLCIDLPWEKIAESMIQHGAKVDKQLFSSLVKYIPDWQILYDPAMSRKTAKSLYDKLRAIERRNARGWSFRSLWPQGQR